jgi:hypothetical protein
MMTFNDALASFIFEAQKIVSREGDLRHMVTGVVHATKDQKK